jgi:hypothetical protein
MIEEWMQLLSISDLICGEIQKFCQKMARREQCSSSHQPQDHFRCMSQLPQGDFRELHIAIPIV